MEYPKPKRNIFKRPKRIPFSFRYPRLYYYGWISVSFLVLFSKPIYDIFFRPPLDLENLDPEAIANMKKQGKFIPRKSDADKLKFDTLVFPSKMEPNIELLNLSQEVLCHILGFLPLSSVLSTGMTCRRLQASVKVFLRFTTKLNLCDTQVWGSLPLSMTDDTLRFLLEKCPKLETLYGLCPQKVENRRLRGKSALSVPGVIDALLLCKHLRKVQTNNFDIFDAILHYLPQVEIDGCFENSYIDLDDSGGTKHLKLPKYPFVTSLHLTGIFMHELGDLPLLEHLQLQWVRFTSFDPFRLFNVPKLKTFVMKHCFGPDLDFGYMRLLEALSRAPDLKRLECIKLPIPGGMIQRVVQESWPIKGFRKLEKLILYNLKAIMPTDIGHLMVAASSTLESLTLSPDIISDNLFASLRFSKCEFPKMKSLTIAYEEWLWPYTPVIETDTSLSGSTPRLIRKPSAISDRGMRTVYQLFPNLETLSVSHAPYVNSLENWGVSPRSWKHLRYLSLCHCYCLTPLTLYHFLKQLQQLEVLILRDMFPVKPSGCSHVGLSAGTGLGLTSVLVQGREENLAIFDEPPINGQNPDPRFFNLHNVNNGVECHQHGNHCHNPHVKVKLENESISSNEAVCGSDSEDDEDFDPLNTPSTSSGITRKRKMPSKAKKYKGPVTRHRSKMFPRRYHQSTQTCFSSLQNKILQNQLCCSTCRINCRCYRANNTYDCEDYPLQKLGEPGSPASKSQDTSTSDPMFGDEGQHVTVVIPSNTLKSLTVIASGIQILSVSCPVLKHLEVQGCTVLRQILIESCTQSLTRINISDCPKFTPTTILGSLARVHEPEPYMLFLNSHITDNPYVKDNIEQVIPPYCFRSYASYLILYDYSTDETDRESYRANLLDWLNFTEELMKALNLNRTSRECGDKMNYRIHRIHGEFSDGSRYELVTNNVLLATVWREREDSMEIAPLKKYSHDEFLEIVSSLREVAADLEQDQFCCDIYRAFYVRLHNTDLSDDESI